VKNWFSHLILVGGILLVIISFTTFGIRVSETAIPVGSTPLQIERLTQEYGLDRPIIQQYGWFLFFFLSGLTLLGFYGIGMLRKREFQHWILVKVFIVLMLVTNTITMLNFLVTAHASLQDSFLAFLLALIVAGLAMGNFVFLLVIWNGYRKGVWAFGIASFVLCTIKFVGHVPVIPVLFELSSVIILIYLIRSSWTEME
jgi:hypothetical protein